MAIKINIKRISIFSCLIVFCLCSSMRCKKADWMYENIDRLDDVKVYVTLLPDKKSYNVGDTLFIEGEFLAKDFNMKDFSIIENNPWVHDFVFYTTDSLGIEQYSFLAIKDSNFRNQQFSSDHLSYNFKYGYKLKKAGKYRIDHGVTFQRGIPDSQGNKVYSTLDIRILSGKKRPRGYNTDAIMYFTNNNKTYVEIVVED